MPTKMPDPLDVMVGARIRVFRIHRKISQTDLADQIGVTFQQVQKYEKGTNRIGASRLSRIAAVLGISVGELFEISRGEDRRFGIAVSAACRTGCIAGSQSLHANLRFSCPACHRRTDRRHRRQAISEEISDEIFNFAPSYRETRQAWAKNRARANRQAYGPDCGAAS